MGKIKTILISENGMKIVNLLFFLSILIRNRGIILIALISWIAYLAYCIKCSSSKTMRVIYKIFIAFATVMVFANLYGMLKYAWQSPESLAL